MAQLTVTNPTNRPTHLKTITSGSSLDMSAIAEAATARGEVLVLDWINCVRTLTTTATSAVDRGAVMYVVVHDSTNVNNYPMFRDSVPLNLQGTSITAKPYSLFTHFPGGLPCFIMGMTDSGAPTGAQVYSERGKDLTTPGPSSVLTITSQVTNVVGTSALVWMCVAYHFEPQALRAING